MEAKLSQMPPPSFIFVRHGQAEHNVAAHGPEGDSAYRNPTYKDAPLTEEGVKQARETGLALAQYNIIGLWSSPLTRCIQTSLEILEETSATCISLHDNLLERLGGGHACNYRKSKSDILKIPCVEDIPGLFNLENLPDYPPLWGARENTHSVTHRMYSICMLLNYIYANSPENSYIVVTSHADAIWCLTGKSLKNAEYVIKTMDELKNASTVK